MCLVVRVYRVRLNRDVTSPLSVLVVGATSPTGLEILRQAPHESITVRAMARHPEGLIEWIKRIEVVEGNVLDPSSLCMALRGVDVVISALGSRANSKPANLLSLGTQNLISAMGASSARRLLCITGIGAGDSRGHGGFFYDRLILPSVLRSVYADKEQQENLVKASDLDWVLVRPSWLTNGRRTGNYAEITAFAPAQKMHAISRADVADFLIREAVEPRYHRRVVNLSSQR